MCVTVAVSEDMLSWMAASQRAAAWWTEAISRKMERGAGKTIGMEREGDDDV